MSKQQFLEFILKFKFLLEIKNYRILFSTVYILSTW